MGNSAFYRVVRVPKGGDGSSSGGGSGGVFVAGGGGVSHHGGLLGVSMVGGDDFDGQFHLTAEQAAKFLALNGFRLEAGENIVIEVSVDEETGERCYRIRTEDYYLSKTQDDVSSGLITFVKGLISNVQSWFKGGIKTNEVVSEGFDALLTGGGLRLWEDALTGDGCLTLDRLLVRKEAIFNVLTIMELKSVGGQIAVSAANAKITRVEEAAGYYRCWYEAEFGQLWRVGDQAQCRRYTGSGLKYYWRVVDGVSSSSAGGEHSVDLSKTAGKVDGGGVPSAGDEIVLFGHRGTDNYRKNIIVISSGSFGSESPSMVFYKNVDGFGALSSREQIVIGERVKFVVDELRISGGDGSTTYRVARERGEWTGGTTAYDYDRFSYQGSIWLCRTDNPMGTMDAPSRMSGEWIEEVVKGEPGADAKYIVISGAQSMKNPTGTDSVVLKAALFGGITGGYRWQYFWQTNGQWLSPYSDNADLTLRWNNEAFSNNVARIRCISISTPTIFDEYTVTNVFDGSPGIPGAPGKEGDKGLPGEPGEPGASAVSYWLVVSPEIVVKRGTGVWPTPTVIRAYGRKKVGNGSETHTGGTLQLLGSVNGSSWTQIGTVKTDNGTEQVMGSLTTAGSYKYYKVSLFEGLSTLGEKTLNVYEEGDVAKDDMATNLGYKDYAAMKANAITNGQVLIRGGLLNADLIEAGAITSKALAADVSAYLAGTMFSKEMVQVKTDGGLKVLAANGKDNMTIGAKPLPTIAEIQGSQSSVTGSIRVPARSVYSDHLTFNSYTDSALGYRYISNNGRRVLNLSALTFDFNLIITRDIDNPIYTGRGASMFFYLQASFYNGSGVQIGSQPIGSDVVSNINEGAAIRYVASFGAVVINAPVGTERIGLEMDVRAQLNNYTSMTQISIQMLARGVDITMSADTSTPILGQMSYDGYGIAKSSHYLWWKASDSQDRIDLMARVQSINTDSPLPFIALGGTVAMAGSGSTVSSKFGYYSKDALSVSSTGVGHIKVDWNKNYGEYRAIASTSDGTAFVSTGWGGTGIDIFCRNISGSLYNGTVSFVAFRVV